MSATWVAETRIHGPVGGAPGHGASGGNPLCCRSSFLCFSLNVRVLFLFLPMLTGRKTIFETNSQWFIQSSNNTVRGLCWDRYPFQHLSREAGWAEALQPTSAVLVADGAPVVILHILAAPRVASGLRTSGVGREGRARVLLLRGSSRASSSRCCTCPHPCRSRWWGSWRSWEQRQQQEPPFTCWMLHRYRQPSRGRAAEPPRPKAQHTTKAPEREKEEEQVPQWRQVNYLGFFASVFHHGHQGLRFVFDNCKANFQTSSKHLRPGLARSRLINPWRYCNLPICLPRYLRGLHFSLTYWAQHRPCSLCVLQITLEGCAVIIHIAQVRKFEAQFQSLCGEASHT